MQTIGHFYVKKFLNFSSVSLARKYGFLQAAPNREGEHDWSKPEFSFSNATRLEASAIQGGTHTLT